VSPSRDDDLDRAVTLQDVDVDASCVPDDPEIDNAPAADVVVPRLVEASRLISSASSDSGLSSINAYGRMSSSDLMTSAPSVYMRAQFRLPP
jgi:hypothetical protein